MLTLCFTASVYGLQSTAEFSFYAYLTKKQKFCKFLQDGNTLF